MNKIKFLQGDITNLQVDALVNAANSSLLGGGGVDGAIHRAAGKDLLEECRGLRGCNTGESKITKGYNLPAKHVIHTVGPIYKDGNSGEPELLRNCYLNSLKLAVENNLKTLAFPCISTGIYGYPFEAACKIALEAVMEFLKENTQIEEVTMVCFSKDDYEKYLSLYEEQKNAN